MQWEFPFTFTLYSTIIYVCLPQGTEHDRVGQAKGPSSPAILGNVLTY